MCGGNGELKRAQQLSDTWEVGLGGWWWQEGISEPSLEGCQGCHGSGNGGSVYGTGSKGLWREMKAGGWILHAEETGVHSDSSRKPLSGF